MNIKIIPIEMGSKEYDEEVKLRTKILREPLGLKYSPEDLILELDDIHLGAFFNDLLVGCLLLRPQLNGVMKMRQVAVDTRYQMNKVGTKLVRFAEVLAKKMGYNTFELHSRVSTLPFYVKLGYEPMGDIFTEISIDHQKMQKNF